uniref:Peripheral subunit-binding (PSBD) domain-containing protein n=1 Tax=Cuerna arida TaxID=1464854 RepID=A0A1B6FXP5_9HEMI
MEKKIKLSDVKGTGKGGRVMKEDILAFLDRSKGGGIGPPVTTRSPLTTVQKVMTRTMTESLKIPQFVFSDQVDVSRLVKLRSEAKEAASKRDIKLSYLPFFLKAFSKGLSEFPILNSSFDLEREEILYKKSHNIGIAVDSPSGLLVPNIKDVQTLSVIEIAKELNRLQLLAAKMKLSPSDLTGGTFSVSNIGAIASTTSAPLILPPEVCIVALGRIQRLPRFDSAGNVFPAHIISLSWSADHRIIDGATVARCFRVFQHYVENPAALLLDL